MPNRPVNEEYARMVEEGLKSGKFGSGKGSEGLQASYGATGVKSELSEAEKKLNEENKGKGARPSGPLSDRLSKP